MDDALPRGKQFRPIHHAEQRRRLGWLLVFRAAVAAALFSLTLTADLLDWQLKHISSLLYAVVVGTFLVVLILGLLLRTGTPPAVLAAVHLAGAVLSAAMVVQGTGGVASALSFLYLLAILDGAIIGARPVALVVATSCSLVYGTQLALQLYGLLPPAPPRAPPDPVFINAFIVHLAAFYLMGLLSGHLANLLGRAHKAASSVAMDLERVQQLHSDVLESLPVGVITHDDDFVVRTANRKADDILAQADGSLVGSMLRSELRKAVAAGQEHGEAEMQFDGSHRHVRLSRAHLFEPVHRGVAEQLQVLVLEDQTNLKALEQSLREKDRLATIGELAAGIAHEIRNPLAAISGSLELLDSESVDPESAERLHRIVRREIVRLDDLVQEFLCYARPSPLEWVTVDLVSLVHEIIEMARAEPKWSTQELRVQAPQRLAADADPAQLRQVLWNLLRNALEASPADAPVDIGIENKDGNVVLRLADQGPGVAPEMVDHLFEPFRTTKEGGSGLGLAIVHRIVTAHGGTVELCSRDQSAGTGAEATVTLPCTRRSLHGTL